MLRRRLALTGRILLFLGFLFLALSVAAKVVSRKESARKYADLHEAARSADVLFLGSSHVINGINPVQLYEEFGIAGYNLGGHGSILPASYYELLCALEEFSPRLVVVDGCLMEREYHYLDEMTEDATAEDRAASVSQLHLNLDVFPLSRSKYYAVRDLIADPRTRLEFLFPFILYHNRWSTLTADDFALSSHAPSANRLLGAEIRMRLDWRVRPHAWAAEASDGVHLGERYLQMILALCRERGIAVALTFLPCDPLDRNVRSSRRLQELSAAEELPYLNLLGDPAFDHAVDFSDDGHLNYLGMTKATRRVGQFIESECPVPDRRGAEGYSLWERRAEQFRALRRELILEAETLVGALLALSADRTVADAVLYLSNGGAAQGDPAVRNLLDALLPENGLELAHAQGAPSLLVFAGEQVREYDLGGYLVSDWEPLPFRSGERAAEVIRVGGEDDYTALYLDGDETDNLLDMEEDRWADAQLVLLPADGSERKQLIFNYKEQGDEP